MTHPPIAPGYYSVPDPWNADRATFWAVDDDSTPRDFPARARWRPLPPDGFNREQRDRWYRTEYREWRAEIARRIAADPATAAQRFHRRYPDPSQVPPEAHRRPPARARKPKPPAVEAVRQRIHRQAQALVVAALRANGATFREVAETLGVPLATVHRRAELGAGLMAFSDVTAVDELGKSLKRLAQVSDDDGRAAMTAALRALVGSQAVPHDAPPQEPGTPHGRPRDGRCQP